MRGGGPQRPGTSSELWEFPLGPLTLRAQATPRWSPTNRDPRLGCCSQPCDPGSGVGQNPQPRPGSPNGNPWAEHCCPGVAAWLGPPRTYPWPPVRRAPGSPGSLNTQSNVQKLCLFPAYSRHSPVRRQGNRRTFLLGKPCGRNPCAACPRCAVHLS